MSLSDIGYKLSENGKGSFRSRASSQVLRISEDDVSLRRSNIVEPNSLTLKGRSPVVNFPSPDVNESPLSDRLIQRVKPKPTTIRSNYYSS